VLGRFIISVLLFVFTQSVFALNPIEWSLNQPFPKEVTIQGPAQPVVYTFTSQLPFTMINPMVIQKVVSPQAEFMFQDTCSGLRLKPRQSCTVAIMLDPLSTGSKEAQLTIAGYDRNDVTLPKLQTTAIQESGRVNIDFSVTTPLPSSMVVSTSASFIFRFTNSGTESATGITTRSSVSTFSSTCGTTLLPGASCNISGTFTPTATTPSQQSVTGTFRYAQGNAIVASTQTTVIPPSGNVTISSSVTTPLPSSMVVNTSASFIFHFTNSGTASATGITTSSSAGSFSSTCGASLLPGASCDISGTFTPTTTNPAQQTVTGTFRYAQGNALVTSTQTTVVPPSGSVNISSSVTTPLPLNMVVNTSATFGFRFTNSGTASATGITTSSSVSGFTSTCGTSLSPGASCTISGTFTPTATNPSQQTVTGTFRYAQGNDIVTSTQTTVIPPSATVVIGSSVTTPLPSSMVVNTSATFVFRFTNSGTASATGVTTSSNSGNFSSTCGATLLAGASCDISGSFTPTSTSPSQQTVTGTFRYAQGSDVVASTQTTVNPATGLTGVISGLPSITIVGASYQVTYTFTNNNPTGMSITANSPQATVAGSYLQQANTCPVVTGVLTAGNTCYMTGLFTPTVIGSSSFSSTLSAAAASPGPTTSTLTTTTNTVAAGGVRTVNFVNECNFKVWFSMNGGAIGNSPNCTSNAQCPDGTACSPSANSGNGLCFWVNPSPAAHPGNVPVSPYELEALGGVNTSSVVVPVAANTVDVNTQWSGNISASALCDGSTKCGLADCGNKGGSASCDVGQGFGQPATQFEITMIKNDRDYYDVEVINGFHIPIQVTPINPNLIPGNEYNCGTPGNPTASGGFGSCNWNNAVVPTPSNAYYWVTNNGACNSDKTCNVAGELCGLDSNIDQVCGNFIGFWSADNACGVNPNKAQPYFGCNNYLGSPYQHSTYQMSALYGCQTPNAAISTLNSCYIFNNSDCCGCANWNASGITIPAATVACKTTSNSIWTSQVQTTIEWMKKTCPNYYTYPYDDESSTFRCSNVASGSNAVGYTVTFCPGGNTGLPAGITEGRG
jgi:hypothetical protein